MRQDVENPGDPQRLGRVDAYNASFRYGRLDDTAIGEVALVEFAGVFRGACDLRAAVDAGCGSADVGHHGFARLIFLAEPRLRQAGWPSTRNVVAST
jgi:hypothetical protein